MTKSSTNTRIKKRTITKVSHEPDDESVHTHAEQLPAEQIDDIDKEIEDGQIDDDQLSEPTEHTEPVAKKYSIRNRFTATTLSDLMTDVEFAIMRLEYDELYDTVRTYELVHFNGDSELNEDELVAYGIAKENYKQSYMSLALKAAEIKHRKKAAKAQAVIDDAVTKRLAAMNPVGNSSTTNGSSTIPTVPAPIAVFQQLRDKPRMLTDLSVESVTRFKGDMKIAHSQAGDGIDCKVYIAPPVLDLITQLLYHGDSTEKLYITNPSRKDWADWSNNQVIESVLALLPPTRQDKNQFQRVLEQVSKIPIHADFDNVNNATIKPVLAHILRILREEQLIDGDELDTIDTIPEKKNFKRILEAMMKNFRENSTPVHNRIHLANALAEITTTQAWHDGMSFSGFLHALKLQMQINQRLVAYHNEIMKQIGSQPVIRRAGTQANNSFHASPGNSPHPSNKRPRNESTGTTSNPACRGCGKHHPGTIESCNFKNHPDFNRKHQDHSWEDSFMGKFYAAHQKTSLNSHLKKEGSVLVSYDEPSGSSSSTTSSKPPYQAKYTPGKGKSGSGYRSTQSRECQLCSISKSMNNTNSIYNAHFFIGNDRLQVKTLLDSGAESGSYINATVAAWLQQRGIKCYVNKSKLVCSCFGDCRMISTYMNASLIFQNFVNNSNNEPNKLCLDFWVIDNLPYDVVIGNLDIEANPWLKHLSDNLPTTPSRPNISCTDSTGQTAGISRHQTLSRPKKVSRNDDSRPSQSDNLLYENIEGQVISPHGVQPKPLVKASRRMHISEILNYEPAANGIPEKWDSLDECLNAEPLMVVQSEPPVELPTHIMGTTELQKDIKELLVEYSDIFRTNVSPKPADVPSMNVRVDKAKWNTMKGNMGVSPRVQSHDKNNEIQRQVNKMLDLGVIQRSNSNRYSQVLLVPKPNEKWRFCIDYQPLNACCEGDGWNLPNIQQMLQRLGSHRPKLFAVMDLTSGYHQAPLNISSRVFTAFITFMGIFEWLRVPMGLKGAASYFQKVLSTVVLLGLVYYVCELYIDDIIVHGQDPESFLVRLRQVFERLRKHNITLNPEKCRFGLSSVEYVGHTIDETGLSFSPEKLNEVLAITPPTYAKELRSFLGLASYFRDHIQNLATIAKPLQDMITDYEKKRKLVWTPEAELAFTDVKEAIRRCPKLFFMDDNAPVYLHTDASDYGIGAYIFQIIDGKELPIAFMSKTLSAEEIKWSTIEKECYAIVFSLRKFEYLLRDKHFTLRTDHANLTYVNDPPSPKVRRWKIAIQEYDFDLEFIDGESNIAADGFSRLLPISVETLCVLKGLKIPDDKYKILGQVHNTNVGHHGLDRMIHKLRSRGQEWKEMRDHVRKFIDNCPCCQKMNNLRVSIKTHPFHLSTTRPMQVIHMDTLSMGITNDNGDSYLLVLIDACSRWLELYPIPDLTAEIAAMKLFEHFGRFGIPGQILSDNGSQFQNKLHDELHTLIGVDKLRTTPYSHEENGIVERANKEILRHVRSILFDKGIHKEWHLAIPIVQRILNSQNSSITGCAPAELILTNAPNLDQGIYMTPQPSTIDNDTLSAWHSKRIDLQQRVLASVNKHRLELEAEKLSHSSTNPTAYAEGSYVLLRYPDEDIIKGHIGKLKLPLKGPMLVVKANRDNYTLQDITTGKNQEVHISRLHPFYYDDTKVDPAEIARKDLDEEVVEAIVDNTTHRSKSKMDFRVRWEGYDSSHDLWLPWRDLRDNPKLHKYLNDNGMSKLIPKEHRKQEYH
jgi:transposase InsO family protein